MTPGEIIAVVSALVTLIGVTSSAVWLVGRVKANGEVNAVHNKRTCQMLDRVSLRLEAIDQRTDDHEGRLIRIETVQGGATRPRN